MSTFEFIKKVANGANQSLENGTQELTKAADTLSSIPARHERMRVIAAEAGALLIEAVGDIDRANIHTLMGGQLLFEVLETLRKVDGERVSALSAKAIEAEEALKKVSNELSPHAPMVSHNFNAAFFAETERATEQFGERVAKAANDIEAAKGHQIAAVEACRQSLENL